MADNYKVTSQRQTQKMIGSTLQPAMDVTFETLDGTVGSVSVPVAQYSADNVHKAIEARVSEIEKVAAL